MKRRLLKLEMERRAEEKHRAMRAAQEAQTAAAGARLARAGFKRSGRRASIMHVGGFLDVRTLCFARRRQEEGPNFWFESFFGGHVTPRPPPAHLLHGWCSRRDVFDVTRSQIGCLFGEDQLSVSVVCVVVRHWRARGCAAKRGRG